MYGFHRKGVTVSRVPLLELTQPDAGASAWVGEPIGRTPTVGHFQGHVLVSMGFQP
jgi:hypothetical protein